MFREPFVGRSSRQHVAHGPLISSAMLAEVPLAGLSLGRRRRPFSLPLIRCRRTDPFGPRADPASARVAPASTCRVRRGPSQTGPETCGRPENPGADRRRRSPATPRSDPNHRAAENIEIERRADAVQIIRLRFRRRQVIGRAGHFRINGMVQRPGLSRRHNGCRQNTSRYQRRAVAASRRCSSS